jgi:hypothetical protein
MSIYVPVYQLCSYAYTYAEEAYYVVFHMIVIRTHTMAVHKLHDILTWAHTGNADRELPSIIERQNVTC